MSIAFNRSSQYFQEHPAASYVSGTSTWDNNFSKAEISSQSSGPGVFVNIKTGIALHNKKGIEKFLLEVFYKKGLKTMQENSINYKYYYIPSPGGGNSGSDIKYKNRGSTFGFAGVIPIYFRLKSKKTFLRK